MDSSHASSMQGTENWFSLGDLLSELARSRPQSTAVVCGTDRFTYRALNQRVDRLANVLRALAARAPYFHNGSAMTLEEAVEFYQTRFTIGFTAREKTDLVAFLRSL